MKKNKTSFFDKFVIFIAILAAIGLVCGAFAGNNDPNQHILIAFIGLAYPFLLLANVMFLLWWLLRKKWLFALLTILIICSGWHTLIATFGLFGDAGSNEKANANLVRVMTYNVHNFKPYGDKINEEVKDKMLDVVKAQNPDIVCFQEFFTRFKGPFDIVDSLKKLLNTEYYYFEPTMQSKSEALGLAIFSKYPIKARNVITFPNTEGNESIFVDLEINNQLIRVYNVHLQSISFGKEDYTYLDQVKVIDAEVSSTKRILRMLKSAFKKRSLQVDVMKAHMKTCKTPFIIAGDFNDTPASYAVTKMTDSLNNAFIKKGQGLGRTYNGKFPNFQIDYIATTKDIEVTNYHIVEAKLSDHFPVRSDLQLKAKPAN
jgi:endonuclease/exonuclease/phosphatase family metal-dependent hydrolase